MLTVANAHFSAVRKATQQRNAEEEALLGTLFVAVAVAFQDLEVGRLAADAPPAEYQHEEKASANSWPEFKELSHTDLPFIKFASTPSPPKASEGLEVALECPQELDQQPSICMKWFLQHV